MIYILECILKLIFLLKVINAWREVHDFACKLFRGELNSKTIFPYVY